MVLWIIGSTESESRAAVEICSICYGLRDLPVCRGDVPSVSAGHFVPLPADGRPGYHPPTRPGHFSDQANGDPHPNAPATGMLSHGFVFTTPREACLRIVKRARGKPRG